MFDDGNVCILIKSNVFILHSPLLVQRSNTLRRLCGDISPDDQVYLTLVSTEDPDVTILEVQVTKPNIFKKRTREQEH